MAVHVQWEEFTRIHDKEKILNGLRLRETTEFNKMGSSNSEINHTRVIEDDCIRSRVNVCSDIHHANFNELGRTFNNKIDTNIPFGRQMDLFEEAWPNLWIGNPANHLQFERKSETTDRQVVINGLQFRQIIETFFPDKALDVMKVFQTRVIEGDWIRTKTTYANGSVMERDFGTNLISRERMRLFDQVWEDLFLPTTTRRVFGLENAWEGRIPFVRFSDEGNVSQPRRPPSNVFFRKLNDSDESSRDSGEEQNIDDERDQLDGNRKNKTQGSKRSSAAKSREVDIIEEKEKIGGHDADENAREESSKASDQAASNGLDPIEEEKIVDNDVSNVFNRMWDDLFLLKPMSAAKNSSAPYKINENIISELNQ